VGIFPDRASVIRLVGALLVEINDEIMAAERRYIAPPPSPTSPAITSKYRCPQHPNLTNSNRGTHVLSYTTTPGQINAGVWRPEP
jgi:hypothetical protein